MEALRNNPYLLISLVLALINFGLWGALFLAFRKYREKQRALLAGDHGATIEDLVLKHKKTLASHNKNLVQLGKLLEELVERNKLSVQRIGVVRFNPFANAGGQMSFALALLDGHDNGIVISSLHSREGTRIYAKPLEQGKASIPLTQEEQQAIENSKRDWRAYKKEV